MSVCALAALPQNFQMFGVGSTDCRGNILTAGTPDMQDSVGKGIWSAGKHK